jgi:quercetin dioxygenase-like cupin family protein
MDSIPHNVIMRFTRLKEEEMKITFAFIVGAAIAVAGSIAVAQESQKSKPAEKPKEVVYASSESASYTERFPGVQMAVVWGDPDKGAHGVFTKFAPDYDAGTHTHTNDVWLVVLKGAFLYRDDAGEKRVGPGEFIRIPGGHKHWSGGDKTEGALFYSEGSAKFDKVDAK